ncbi:hypothetical protein VTK26DRAFT_8287 [Humicola hyalothermophila]
MPLEVIYVTRHGFRSNWLVDPQNGNYSNYIKSPTGLAADPALTAHGVDQANELAARLLRVDPPIDRVYSSLYYRCLQTIEPFVRKASATPSGMPQRVRGETGLGEWYGSADFEHPVPASPEVLGPLFPGLLEPGYTPAITPNRMGEGIDELHDRVAATMEALIAECDRDGVRAILLCSHAAVIIALGRVLTGQMPDNFEVEDFRCFTAGLSVYRRRQGPGAESWGKGGNHVMVSAASDARNGDQAKDAGARSSSNWRAGRGVAGGWDCELNSDCSHLSLGEERGWRFSGDESFRDLPAGPSILHSGTQSGVSGTSKDPGRRAKDSRSKL